MLEERGAQTEEEAAAETCETGAQATVMMLDEELETETLAPETREFGVQANPAVVRQRNNTTAIRSTTYKLVTIEKHELNKAKSYQQRVSGRDGMKKEGPADEQAQPSEAERRSP